MPPTSRPSYGTTLPVTPYDGQEAILVDSVSNPTYQWRFRYNASSTSAYKWEFIGGSSAAPYYATTDTLASTGWQNGNNPNFTVPRSGEYFCSGELLFTPPSVPVLLGLQIYLAGAGTGPQNFATLNGSANYQSLAAIEILVTATAAQQITHGYYSSLASTTVAQRVLVVRPKRVS